jgi:D-aminopeptidase
VSRIALKIALRSPEERRVDGLEPQRPRERLSAVDRLRDLGLRIGELEAGARDAITDVPGLRVGQVTVRRDEDEPPRGRGIARTGVTAILPRPVETLVSSPVPAGAAVLNGAGELTGFVQVGEWGEIETPVYLTSTLAVGRVYDGAVAVALAADDSVGTDNFVIPVVGECDDSWLNDARIVQVEAADAGRAIEEASDVVEEGAVGAGTGMICFGWKGGIGTASRLVGGDTIGVLALTNFGTGRQLRIDGVPVGRFLVPPPRREQAGGSSIVVVATDAPLRTHELTRLARRAGLGLARVGSVAHHGSGEIFIAFSTSTDAEISDYDRNAFFAAVVDATEESVLNSLWAAEDTTGRSGRLIEALPHEPVLDLLRRHGRLSA